MAAANYKRILNNSKLNKTINKNERILRSFFIRHLSGFYL